MLFRRLYDVPLAQASYLLGCRRAGTAVVVDPLRDPAPYLALAREEGLRITHVTETHIHADYLSGSRALAEATGATLLLSAHGGADWSYRFASAAGATLLHDGDAFRVGAVELRAVHTPGHTPEHLAFLVTDTATSTEPMGLLSGDFLFVGDVGRPDLLERAAHVEGTMERAARDLFHSVQRARAWPDWLQLWPGHGAGSACGKALGELPQSTLGYERRTNWAFQLTDEEAFVRAVLEGQPAPPLYFAAMKRLNRDGPPPLPAAEPPPPLPAPQLGALLARGVHVLDVRAAPAFAAAHVPGTINVPDTKSFVSWAGSLVPVEAPFALLLGDEDGARATRLRDALLPIALDHCVGWFGPDALVGATAQVPQVSVAEAFARQAAGAVVLDVRNDDEWRVGHVPGALHQPLATLAEHLADVPSARPVLVHCQGGTRSAIATSLLRARGVDAIDVRGGFGAWVAGGLPVAR